METSKVDKLKITKPKLLIWIRGAGEIGSATAVSLWKSGFNVIISEINPPLAIRRSVTFSDAIVDGKTTVAGIHAKHIQLNPFDNKFQTNYIPVYLDNPVKIRSLSPTILIDARMIKTYNEDYRNWADYVIGFGPGFSTSSNCHTVIETMRGHNLGEIIFDGSAMKDTLIPGTIGGESKRRVLYAESEGYLKWSVKFGDIVEEGELMGFIDSSVEILSPFYGMVRGLIHPSVQIKPGLKIADVDPRGKEIDFRSLSDKARSLSRAGLEATMIFLKNHP